jgi:uncharacterized protein (TIRG00374 family)
MQKKYFFLGIVISLLLLFFAFRRIDFKVLKDTFFSVRWQYLFYTIAITIVSLVIRSIRWMFIIDRKEVRNIFHLFESTCVGLMANNILPLRLGDIAQAFFLGCRENISKSFTFSTVLIERILDIIVPLICFFVISLFCNLPIFFMNRWRDLLVTFIVFFAIFILFLLLLRKILPQEYSRLNSVEQRIVNVIRNFLEAFKMKRATTIIIILVLTLMLWVSYVACVYVLLPSVNIKPLILTAIVVNLAAAISVVIPSAPGYLGNWEFFVSLGLREISSVSYPRALSFAIIYHISQYIPVTLLGLFFLTRAGVRLYELGKVKNA